MIRKNKIENIIRKKVPTLFMLDLSLVFMMGL